MTARGISAGCPKGITDERHFHKEVVPPDESPRCFCQDLVMATIGFEETLVMLAFSQRRALLHAVALRNAGGSPKAVISAARARLLSLPDGDGPALTDVDVAPLTELLTQLRTGELEDQLATFPSLPFALQE